MSNICTNGHTWLQTSKYSTAHVGSARLLSVRIELKGGNIKEEWVN